MVTEEADDDLFFDRCIWWTHGQKMMDLYIRWHKSIQFCRGRMSSVKARNCSNITYMIVYYCDSFPILQIYCNYCCQEPMECVFPTNNIQFPSSLLYHLPFWYMPCTLHSNTQGSSDCSRDLVSI
jgi:hypothetical protein